MDDAQLADHYSTYGWREGRRANSLQSRADFLGMVPRGEVGVVIASLGLAAGVFSNQTYAVIVAMSLLTSIVTPPVLQVLLRHAPADAETPRAAG